MNRDGSGTLSKGPVSPYDAQISSCVGKALPLGLPKT